MPSNSNVNYNERLEAFKLFYPEILKMSLAENSPFYALKEMMEQLIKDDVVGNAESFQTLANSLTMISQGVISQAQSTSLSLVLQGDENELNAEKAKLIQAQTATESKKPALIDRQRTQIDDALAIESAKIMQGYSFGLATGGLDIPASVEKLVKDYITALGNRIQDK